MAVLLLTVVFWLLPARIWMKDSVFAGDSFAETTGKIPACLTGRVWKIEKTSKGQAVYLKHSNVSDTGIILVYLNAEQELFIGNILKIKQEFEVQEPEPPSNPGQFDAQLYYQTEGVCLFCYANEAEVVDAHVDVWRQAMYQLRICLGEQCDRVFGEKDSSVLKAMLLGEKKELDADVKRVYQKSGMSHLLSISGLHISLLGVSLYRFLRKIGGSYPLAGIPSLLFVLFYGSLTGMSTSTARAVTMFVLAVTADILGKSYDMLTALAAAALLLLLEQPLYARNAGFLLSFGAVLGIGVLYPAVEHLFRRHERSRFLQSFLVSCSIQILTFPLIQYFYYEFPLYSILLNLLVIPLMGILMPAGIFALLFSFISLPGAAFLALPCKGILWLYEWLGQKCLSLPGAVFISGQPALWQILVYYAGIVAFVWRQYRNIGRQKWKTERQLEEEKEKEACRERRRSLRCSQLRYVILYAVLCVLLTWRFTNGFRFTMLDVGQGDGLFLQTAAGTTCLIDCGSTDVKQVGTYRLIPFLKSQGIRKLDFVCVTHTDADHTSGIEELLEAAGEPGEVSVGTLVLPAWAEPDEPLCRLAKQRGIFVFWMGKGGSIRDATTQITCLHPTKEKTYADKNAGSLVLQVTYGDFSMLLTGDLEEQGEQEILEMKAAKERQTTYAWDFCCDILKVGHHGSSSSTSESWLDAVRPKVALISCGEGNSYGHPHAETLERLKEAGSTIFTTPECGAVTVHSDGETYWIEKWKRGE